MRVDVEVSISLCERKKKRGWSHQDEEALVGNFLVITDGGEDRQHQAAEHQQKSATHTNTQGQ